MDIYSYLKKDHLKVADLLDQITYAENDVARERLYESLRDELLIHADTEEKTFYKALKDKGGKAVIEKEEHAEEEHGEIRTFLKECDGEEVGSEPWLLSFGQLKHAVEHHVKEEEGEIFDKAKDILSESEAEALADEMDKLKQKQTKPVA